MESRDRYTQKFKYGKLRSHLEPRERALHNNFPGSIQAFKRGKWRGFKTTQNNLVPILKVVIAQVAGSHLRPYADYPGNLRRQAEKVRQWNTTANKWVPGYQGADVDAYVRGISTSARKIESFVKGLITQDLQLYEGGNSLDGDAPGTIPYLAVVSHSVSREIISAAVSDKLVSKVTRG